ncbi:glycosyltransferase [Mucilaginibacter corticis]|uniref:Glycosyltransferase n=1 Tax=Mucilaginibacter corticis TaxID=2597670 RepID=A0A556MM85_9SPHI|nr:glycosyltransferase [Mucilaginibacter corticis]TSJ40985.1 glycosyltransferase [Mucilaginibacter corticis]
MENKKMNIVFFPHSVNYGLAGTNRLQNIIYFLKKEGAGTVANIALVDEPIVPGNENPPFLTDYKEIAYGPSVFNFLKHIFQTGFHLYKFRKKDSRNLIYFYGEVDIKNFFFVTWGRMLGYRVVIDIVEDLEAIQKFKSFKNKLKYKSAIFFRKRLDRYADGFTVVSSHLEKKIRLNFPDRPVFFLPVTINKYLLDDHPDGRPAKPLTIFYSGSFNEKDGLPYLLGAAGELKQAGYAFRILLSGKGTDAEMQAFREIVQRAGLEEQVRYLGFLDRDEYIRILSSAADVLCMTRINSAYANAGFPFKLGEFLATGKPVIASTVGDVPKYLSADDAYLVAPESIAEIRAALIAIVSDPKKAVQVGLNGKRAAMKYFDHENYAGPLKEFFEKQINS